MSDAAGPMAHLIRIDQPGGWSPMHVRHMHRNGVVSITLEKTKARRFLQQDSAALDQVAQIAARWPQTAVATYVPEGP